MKFDLKTELSRRGMTQRALARSINAEECLISKYANGHVEPGERMEGKIREALGLVNCDAVQGEAQVTPDE
jgi:ribosome-binding protein aMBF1 (putative translation factor)